MKGGQNSIGMFSWWSQQTQIIKITLLRRRCDVETLLRRFSCIPDKDFRITPVLANLISHTLIRPLGKIKIENFQGLIYTGIGRHDTSLVRLTSLNVMTSLKVTLLSPEYGGRLQSKWQQYQKPTFRNERYARKRTYHGCEGQIEKIRPSGSQSDVTRLALWCQTVTIGTDFSIYPQNPY